jgi:transcriptional regulator with GAF, ATPase, and Fis domain
MIWTSFTSLVVIDLTIVGMAVVMLVIAISRGMFRKGETPRTGRLLIAAGVLVTSAYYLAELVAITTLPLNVVDYLQIHLRLLSTVVSVAFIVAGFVVVAFQRSSIEAKIRTADERAMRAEASVIDSETRFRRLIEQYTDSVYCFEFQPPIDVSLPLPEQVRLSHEAVLVDCNSEFAKSMEVERPSEILGIRFGDMDSARDTEAHGRFFTAFVESGYLLSGYDQFYQSPKGEPRALHIRFRGVVENGHLLAVWGAERNIIGARQTEQALESREQYQELLAGISGRLLTSPSENMGAAIEDSLRDACRYVDADRATLVWFDRAAGSVETLYFWTDKVGPPVPKFSLDSFPSISQMLDAGRSVSFGSVDELPDSANIDKASLREMAIKAAAIVPLVVDGKVKGCCSITNSIHERTWTEQNMSDLNVVGELFANAVYRQKSSQQLGRLFAELEEARDRLEAENVYLQQEIQSTHGFHELVGESNDLRHCLRQVTQVSATRTPVLIQGETGTGKELIARAIHEHSDRSKRPLVKINCAALPANLIESELFGHEPGAFTGAQSHKRGRFDLADHGTLFLDEIGDFPFELQGKLLRVLQDGEFQRLGGTDTIRVNARIIAATNRRLIDAVDRGEFRADLFYRINTFTIELPPLRSRHGDIPLLAQHFVNIHAPQLGRHVTAISRPMLDELESYSWPGNVRELESVIQRALITTTGSQLRLDEPLDKRREAESPGDVSASRPPADLRSAEREHIRAALEQTGWKIAGDNGAAKRLGIPPSTLRSRMKKLDIVRQARAENRQTI